MILYFNLIKLNKMIYTAFLKIYIILTIYINYSYTFDCNLYPILKKLFNNNNYINNKFNNNKYNNNNNYNNNNYYSRENAKYNRRYKLSKFMIDNTVSNIVGPKNNITNVSKNIIDFTNFLEKQDTSPSSNN